MNIFTPGYKELRSEFNLVFDRPWTDSLDWWFGIGETLYHNGFKLPEEWKYQDYILHSNGYLPDEYPDDWLADMLDTNRVTESDLFAFGCVLFRYLNILRNAGMDYEE